MTYHLYIDTSTTQLAVGISKDGKVIYQQQYAAWQKQSEWTMVEVDKALKTVRIKPQNLSRIVVANGPGSYTGVRIALTIGKVLASLLQIGLCPLSSLAVIAGAKGQKIALIDARSNRAYIGVYSEGKLVEEEQVLTLPEVHEVIDRYPEFEVVGDTQLVQKTPTDIAYIEQMMALSQLYPDVSNVDTVTPRYLKG